MWQIHPIIYAVPLKRTPDSKYPLLYYLLCIYGFCQVKRKCGLGEYHEFIDTYDIHDKKKKTADTHNGQRAKRDDFAYTKLKTKSKTTREIFHAEIARAVFFSS